MLGHSHLNQLTIGLLQCSVPGPVLDDHSETSLGPECSMRVVMGMHDISM